LEHTLFYYIFVFPKKERLPHTLYVTGSHEVYPRVNKRLTVYAFNCLVYSIISIYYFIVQLLENNT